MIKNRFFLSADQWALSALRLEGEEAHHCRSVMRCREGEWVTIFDGRGREASARITSLSKTEVNLEKGEDKPQSIRPTEIVLAQAIPKGKNMEWIIQKATELGASRIVPLMTSRTIVEIDARESEKKRQKWQRVALEACKQCGQNWLPVVDAPRPLADFIREDSASLRLVASLGETAITLKKIMADWNSQMAVPPDSASIMIGPEGDFADEEMASTLSHGFRPLSLGPLVLRSETAAIHALGILSYELR